MNPIRIHVAGQAREPHHAPKHRMATSAVMSYQCLPLMRTSACSAYVHPSQPKYKTDTIFPDPWHLTIAPLQAYQPAHKPMYGPTQHTNDTCLYRSPEKAMCATSTLVHQRCLGHGLRRPSKPFAHHYKPLQSARMLAYCARAYCARP